MSESRANATIDRPSTAAINLPGLVGHKVVISGGAGALGRAISTAFDSAGALVVVNDLASEEDASVQSFARHAVFSGGDVANPEDAQRAISMSESAFGGLPDTVCCHAGVVVSDPVDKMSLENFDFAIRNNLRSAFVLAQAAVRRWREFGVGGHLIFTTSWVHDVPWPGIAPYSAAKAGTVALARSFARELAPHGIRANAVAPGIVGAGMAKRQWDTDPDYRHRASKAIPLGELQSPESVADAFLFLASDLASYMTGSVITVDGGCSLYPMD